MATVIQNDALRVLLVTEASSAGAGRHVMDLAAGLLERQCDVHVIYSERRIDDNFADKLKTLPGLKSRLIDMRRAPHPSDFRVVREMRKYVREEGPFDVVHGHSTKGGAVIRMLGKSSQGAVVYTPHCIYTMNPTLKRLTYRITRSVERMLAHRTDAIVAVSPEEKEHIAALGIDHAKVHYVANGVTDLQWHDAGDARRRLGLPANDLVIGFIGRMSDQKNPFLMLEAFQQVASQYENVCLAMVGSGPLQSAAEQLATELGLQDRVHWLGYRAVEEVMPTFDVLAMPSRYEGMPYVLIEALSAGLPIVATSVGGTGSTIAHGKNGLVVDDHCPRAVGRALEKLIVDDQMRARFAATSQRMAVQFTADTMVDATYELYCRLLNRTVDHDMPSRELQMAGV